RMTGMAAHPMPFDLMRRGSIVETLPKIDILDRFLVGGAPVPCLPRGEPTSDSVTNILAVGIEPYPTRPLQRLARRDGRHQLHSVVGCHGLGAGESPLDTAVAQDGAPTSRSRIAAAGAVGEDFDGSGVRLGTIRVSRQCRTRRVRRCRGESAACAGIRA